MRVITGVVVEGRVVVEGEALTEGASVTVLAPDDDSFQMSSEDEATLLERIAEADRGELVDEAELFARLASQA